MARRLREAEASEIEIYLDQTIRTTLIAAMSRPLRSIAPVLGAVENFVLEALRKRDR